MFAVYKQTADLKNKLLNRISSYNMFAFLNFRTQPMMKSKITLKRMATTLLKIMKILSRQKLILQVQTKLKKMLLPIILTLKLKKFLVRSKPRPRCKRSKKRLKVKTVKVSQNLLWRMKMTKTTIMMPQ